ncbi:MAG TPA: tripartite tricarboxylate transporter substrate binding protein [Ramlibacter sp.]|jgi:tripartite-type tricarboxylate transporter receptor subunit TctC
MSFPHPAPLCAIVFGLLALASGWTQAQAWPSKPIKLLAPSTPGGPPDVYARALADNLAKALGQPVVVENVPAAGGMIIAQQMLRAQPDGYTLLVNTAGMMTITPNANPLAKYKGDDFAQICQGVEAGLVLAAHPQLGPKNIGELQQWIKAQKVPPTYSSYSAGSPAHFLGYQLSEALKAEMTHVPYKSTPQQVTDMLGGVAPLGFVQLANATPHIKAGKLVAYVTTGARRSPQLPDVPTVAEAGLPQLTTTVWFGLSGPKALPPAIVQRLTAVHEQVTASPEFQARMATAGLTVSQGVCGEAFLKKMNVETERWGRVVKATGFVATD